MNVLEVQCPTCGAHVGTKCIGMALACNARFIARDRAEGRDTHIAKSSDLIAMLDNPDIARAIRVPGEEMREPPVKPYVSFKVESTPGGPSNEELVKQGAFPIYHQQAGRVLRPVVPDIRHGKLYHTLNISVDHPDADKVEEIYLNGVRFKLDMSELPSQKD